MNTFTGKTLDIQKVILLKSEHITSQSFRCTDGQVTLGILLIHVCTSSFTDEFFGGHILL